MTHTKYIPAGRTSLINRGNVPIQVQTEYAWRPYPRLTTTVLNQGQVLHKIEHKLENPIRTQEDQSLAEDLIKRQHTEVLGILRAKRPDAKPASETTQPGVQSSDSSPDAEVALLEKEPVPDTVRERLMAVAGVEHIYSLDNAGQFATSRHGDHFKKAFSSIFKGVRDLVEVFRTLPGETMTREKGVYEVERNRLYLISCGDECLLVTVHQTVQNTAFEKVLKEAIDGGLKAL